MAVEDRMEQEDEGLDKKKEKKAARARKKEEKKAAKEIKEETVEEESGGSRLAVVVVTIAFISVWLGILALVIKADIGGFGSTVLQPVLKDVPYINKILPKTTAEEEVVDAQYPYTTLDEAIARIKELELQLSEVQEKDTTSSDKVAELEAEVARLQEFENQQSAFEQEKTKFYKEVVFADNAPDISEYKAYYESIDPANAEILYKQVVEQKEADAQILEYADTYAQMKPKQAAAILEKMTDNLELVAKILENIDTAPRGAILGAMDLDVAARITKIMEP